MPLGSALVLPDRWSIQSLLETYRNLPRSDAYAANLRECREIVVADHKATLLAGLNSDGQPTAPLSFNTRRSRKGSGPPRVPHGENSRLIRNFDTLLYKAEDDGGGGTVWVLEQRLLGSAAAFAGYFQVNTRYMPARPWMGVSPVGWQKLLEARQRFLMTIGK